MRFMLFFNEISILCQRNKKLNGPKKCDWMRPLQLKEECVQRPSPAGECSVDRGPWVGGASGGPVVRPGSPGTGGKVPPAGKCWRMDTLLFSEGIDKRMEDSTMEC